MSLSFSGSLSPAASTTIRSAPWGVMFGSRVPKFVDPAADDLDRLLDGLVRLGLHGVGHVGDADLLVGLDRDGHVATTHGALQRRADGLAQRPGGRLDLSRVGDAHHDVVVVDRHRLAGGDLLVGQHLTGVFDDVGEQLLAERVGIDLEQQVRAALQVQAQVERLFGREARKARPDVGGYDVGRREQHANHNRDDDEENLPAREGQHRKGTARFKSCRWRRRARRGCGRRRSWPSPPSP
jgi:hypothetical protein